MHLTHRKDTRMNDREQPVPSNETLTERLLARREDDLALLNKRLAVAVRLPESTAPWHAPANPHFPDWFGQALDGRFDVLGPVPDETPDVLYRYREMRKKVSEHYYEWLEQREVA